MCNSHVLSNQQRWDLSQRGFLFDDQGDHISHDNCWLGDLTGLYWVWRNTEDEWVGTNQYRRFYDEPNLYDLVQCQQTLWISNWVGFRNNADQIVSIAEQYASCHGRIGLDILYEAAQRKSISIPVHMIESMTLIQHLSPCNMFFGHRQIFSKICKILFDVIFELRAGAKYALPYVQPNNQTRMLAFLAERVLSLIYHNHRYFLGNVNIVPVPYHTHVQ